VCQAERPELVWENRARPATGPIGAGQQRRQPDATSLDTPAFGRPSTRARAAVVKNAYGSAPRAVARGRVDRRIVPGREGGDARRVVTVSGGDADASSVMPV